MRLSESTITDSLIGKYSQKYVCIPQCKSGATWYNGSLAIMDLWAMAKSWAHPNTLGFEIKISRSDFLNDTKWQGYLEYCNEFYFVAPSTKIIAPEEVPEQAGLMCLSSTGNVIYTKKKAPHRDVEIPEELYRYILMHRIKIVDHSEHDHENHIEFWQSWLEEKKITHELGWSISKALKERIDEEVIEARKQNAKLQAEIIQLNKIIKFLESIGVDYHREWLIEDRIYDRLNEIESGFSKQTQHDINQCIQTLQRIKDSLFSEDKKAVLQP